MINRQMSMFGSRPLPPPVLQPEAVDSDQTDIDYLDPYLDAISSFIWSRRELSAWAPPENIRVSDWAVKFRMISARQNALPGPWTNRPYYTVELMDSFTSPLVESITIMASVQSSKTESFYNMLGFAIDQDPAPALIVMPTLASNKRAGKRILSMIEESPQLARHITKNPDDLTRAELALDNMTVHFATAGSTTDLRHVTARYILMDEVDDYPETTEDQGSPIEMAKARATTFKANRKFITCSTPTTPDAHITQEYAKSDKRRYYVPCPECRGYQQLSFWQIKCSGAELGKWPADKRTPEFIRSHRIARYECVHCGHEIDDRDKPWMLQLGTWVTGEFDESNEWRPTMDITVDGTCSFPRPVTSHAGFHWNALYSPWLTFSDIAAKYFETKDSREKYKTFVNLWLAEPWKEVILTASESAILKARCDLAPQTVPAEAIALTAFVDCQKYGFWFAVRAWARDYSSWLVHYGQLSSWDDVENLLFESAYPVCDSDLTMKIWRAGIDTGGGKSDEHEYDPSMTERAYAWLRKNMVGRGCRVWGTKGSSHGLAGKIHLGKVLDKTPSGKPLPPIPGVGGLQLVMLDTSKLKDAYHYRLQLAIEGQPGGLYLHSGTDENYAAHILAEEKRRTKSGAEEWVKVKPRNDLFDCECGAIALADPEWPGGGINLIRSAPNSDLNSPNPERKPAQNPYLSGRSNPFSRS